MITPPTVASAILTMCDSAASRWIIIEPSSQLLDTCSQEREMRYRQIRSERPSGAGCGRLDRCADSIEKGDYALRAGNQVIYNLFT
jgi:hypothetical protein